MSKAKRSCRNLNQREEQLREINASLERLQQLGLIGESRMVDGEKQYYVGTEHLAIMLQFLSHPEKWPDTWNDEQKAKCYAVRDKAIAKGLIQP